MFVVMLSLKVAASCTMMSAQANPQIPLGAPPFEGVEVAPCPKAAPPKLGPHQPSVGLSCEPGHVGVAIMSPVTGSAKFLEYQLRP